MQSKRAARPIMTFINTSIKTQLKERNGYKAVLSEIETRFSRQNRIKIDERLGIRRTKYILCVWICFCVIRQVLNFLKHGQFQRIPVCGQNITQKKLVLNLLKTRRNLLYIRNQSVPRCKHFPPQL